MEKVFVQYWKKNGINEPQQTDYRQYTEAEMEEWLNMFGLFTPKRMEYLKTFLGQEIVLAYKPPKMAGFSVWPRKPQ